MKSKNKALNIQDIRNLAAEFYKTLEAERVALRARVAELESERDAVRQHAGDATEYVLAQINNDLRARVAELEALLTAICEMQQRNYGHRFDTHIDLSGLCDKARAVIAKAEGDDELSRVVRERLDNPKIVEVDIDEL